MLGTLNLRQKLAYGAHLFKALTKERFAEMEPLLEKYIPKDAVVMDVGANAGYFTKVFSRMAPEGRVYAFEPGSYAGSILKRVVSMRGLHNVVICPFGLSDQRSHNTLHMPVKAKGNLGFGLSHLGHSHAVDARATKTEEIHLNTLDIFVTDMEIDRIDFIKCDTEGWEMRMLVGASASLKKFRPVLMLEVVDAFLGRAGDSAKALWNFLHDHNYNIYRIAENGDLISSPTPPEKEYWDIICIPR